MKPRSSGQLSIDCRTMRITLARHGRIRAPRLGWIAPSRIGEWAQLYDEADLLNEAVPSAALELAAASRVIVSSTMRRAVQSAQLVAQGKEVQKYEIFSEATLPYPNWRYPALPVPVWALMLRAAWLRGYANNAISIEATEERARLATDKLIQFATEHDSVFLVTHGVMAALIARHLVRAGWVGPRRPSYAHWGLSAYHAASQQINR